MMNPISLKKLSDSIKKVEEQPHFRTLEDMAEIMGNIFEGGDF